jgi:hypothetical protein
MLFFLRIGWDCTSGAFLGKFWSQLVFAAHDAGFFAITHDFNIGTLIGMIIAALTGDLFCWAGGKGLAMFIISLRTLVITIQITSFYRSLQSIIVSLAIKGPHTISDF